MTSSRVIDQSGAQRGLDRLSSAMSRTSRVWEREAEWRNERGAKTTDRRTRHTHVALNLTQFPQPQPPQPSPSPPPMSSFCLLLLLKLSTRCRVPLQTEELLFSFWEHFTDSSIVLDCLNPLSLTTSEAPEQWPFVSFRSTLCMLSRKIVILL